MQEDLKQLIQAFVDKEEKHQRYAARKGLDSSIKSSVSLKAIMRETSLKSQKFNNSKKKQKRRFERQKQTSQLSPILPSNNQWVLLNDEEQVESEK